MLFLVIQVHIKQGNHLLGARLLCRVANNISKFPSRESCHILAVFITTNVCAIRCGTHPYFHCGRVSSVRVEGFSIYLCCHVDEA